MELDESKIFTCKDVKNIALGSYGYFANNIGDLKSRICEENKKFYGKLTDVLDESNNCRFVGKVFCDSEFAGAIFNVAGSLFYLVKEPKEKKFRPYKNTNEMIEDFKKRCALYDKNVNSSPLYCPAI